MMKGVAVFFEIAAPAVVMLEQQLCGARNIHGAESTVRQRAGKGHRRQPAHDTGVLILCWCQRGGGMRRRASCQRAPALR